MIRFYSCLEEDAATIAQDVLAHGESAQWAMRSWGLHDVHGRESLPLAAKIEERLSRFNIGYIDDNYGAWGYRLGGSTFFRKLGALGAADASSQG